MPYIPALYMVTLKKKTTVIKIYSDLPTLYIIYTLIKIKLKSVKKNMIFLKKGKKHEHSILQVFQSDF